MTQKETKKDRLERIRIATAIYEAIPVGATFENILLALNEVERQMIRQMFEEDKEL